MESCGLGKTNAHQNGQMNSMKIVCNSLFVSPSHFLENGDIVIEVTRESVKANDRLVKFTLLTKFGLTSTTIDQQDESFFFA